LDWISYRNLERDWAELQQKGVEVSAALQRLYRTKREELLQKEQLEAAEKQIKAETSHQGAAVGG
jgi:outer membrane protein assembly factor BamA